jgi:hypothetical protein
MKLYEVQEFKVWKGINKYFPVWNCNGTICNTWLKAYDAIEYSSQCNIGSILRIKETTV